MCPPNVRVKRSKKYATLKAVLTMHSRRPSRIRLQRSSCPDCGTLLPEVSGGTDCLVKGYQRPRTRGDRMNQNEYLVRLRERFRDAFMSAAVAISELNLPGPRHFSSTDWDHRTDIVFRTEFIRPTE